MQSAMNSRSAGARPRGAMGGGVLMGSGHRHPMILSVPFTRQKGAGKWPMRGPWRSCGCSLLFCQGGCCLQ